MRALFSRRSLLRALSQPAVGRYLVVGGSVYLLELVIIVLAEHSGLSTMWAVSLSYSIGVIASFLLQKLFTFRDRRTHRKIVAGQALAVGLLLIWNYIFTLAMVAFLGRILPGVIIRTIALAITTVWNFYLYKTRIFRNEQAEVGTVRPPDQKKSHVVKRRLTAVAHSSHKAAPKTGKKQRSKTNKRTQQFVAWRLRIPPPVLPFAASKKHVILAASAFLLLATSCVWSVLGARVQATNADQLVDPYMFDTYAAFHEAMFPGTHTFLFKWPFFVISSLFGNTSGVLVLLTCLVSLATVGALMYVLFRIEKRPLVLALYYCVLSVLLLQVPAQPHPAALLPANFAMLTTRNLEYILYIAGLVLLFRAKKLVSVRAAVAIGLLAVLFASDRLFAGLSIGGAVVGTAVLRLRNARAYSEQMVRWLAASIAAFLLSIMLLGVIRATGLTHIDASEHSPYKFLQTPKQAAVAAFYLVHGALTQLGVNPAYDAMEMHDLGKSLHRNLVSLGAPAYLASLGAAGFAAYRLGRYCWEKLKKNRPVRTQKKTCQSQADIPVLLTAALGSTSLAAAGLFLLTDHYYPADSRYLTIVFFSGVIGYATVARKHAVDKYIYRLLAVAALCIPFALMNTLRMYDGQLPPARAITSYNNIVHEVLRAHEIHQLVGDYWRVIPARLNGGSFITPIPLEDCTQPRKLLSSGRWKLDHNQSFAYILRSGPGLAGNKPCAMHEVTAAYGQPYDIVLLPDGRERLLLYAGTGSISTGSRDPKRAANRSPLRTACPGGETGFSIIAHQDDDLLFMNPDTYQSVQAGNCIRTAYLTTGDAGADVEYESMRVKGAKSAYEAMLGFTVTWRQGFLKLPTGQRISFLEGYGPGEDTGSPASKPRVTFLLFHLPDGNLTGSGYNKDKFVSLKGMIDGSKASIAARGGSAVYTAAQLTGSLVYLMNLYQPAYVQSFAVETDTSIPDHSDHIATGLLARKALQQYLSHKKETSNPELRLYTGYPIQDWPENLDEDTWQHKQRIFLEYAKFDSAVCQTAEICYDGTNTYGYYLLRQYGLQKAE